MRDHSLRGAKAIGEYLGISPNRVSQWRFKRGCPVARMPTGELLTTTTLLDTWLISKHLEQVQNQKKSRALRNAKRAALARSNRLLEDGSYEDAL